MPEQPWESLKIGGTSPVLTPLGWLAIFHGVVGTMAPSTNHRPSVRYCSGVLILERDDPRNVRYRSATPILAPDTAGEQYGSVNNVVLPTGVDARQARRIDRYDGMADARIGVARMEVPATLPVG